MAGVQRQRDSDLGSSERRAPPQPQPTAMSRFLAYTPVESNEEAKAHVREELKRYLGTPMADSRRPLPVPLAHTVVRSNLEHIKSRMYYVAEKSDGVRKLLLVTMKGVWLVDRAWTMLRLPDPISRVLMKTLAPSLIDGELIDSPFDEYPTFVTYDCPFLRGNDLSRRSFGTRLSNLAKAVDDFKAAQEASQEFYMTLFMKLIVPINQAVRVTSKIVTKSDHNGNTFYEFKDLNRGRRNKTDGLIFTQDQAWYIDNNNPDKKPASVVKWKWPELQTIDFKLKAPYFNGDNTVDLYVGGTHHSDIKVKTIPMDQRLKRSINTWISENRDYVIAEMRYDRPTGLWVYCHVREDKTTANFVTTVFATMETMVDNIDFKEICEFCSSCKSSAVSSPSYH